MGSMEKPMEKPLSSQQSAALFDILTHWDFYAEIRDFRYPGTLDHYGPPFEAEHGRPSTTPGLQSLLSRFVLKLPGWRDAPPEFWSDQVPNIIGELEKANLSESYDKGVIGNRMTVTTAFSSIIEYPLRGTVGGFAKTQDEKQEYDHSKAEDLQQAFRDLMNKCIYTDILDEMAERTGESDRLSDQEPLVQATYEFLLHNVASFMHYFLILSPKGQFLLKMGAHVNRLIPWTIIRQTLKIGNAATMINAMMRVILAKISVTSVTNWIGLTKRQDDGMNLLQQIISTVLSWDQREFSSRASAVEKAKFLSKDQLKCLKEYANLPREQQESIRRHSQKNGVSIAISTLSTSSLSIDMSEAAHKQALEYLASHLSIRDRKEIIRVLCHSKPDHLTKAVKAGVACHDQIIRDIHKAVNLGESLHFVEDFIRDTLKMATIKPPGKDGETVIPTVGDFVVLLKKHHYGLDKFLHQCCKNGKELTGWYLGWLKIAAENFKAHSPSAGANAKAAGDFTDNLNDLFSQLSKEQQEKILPILDQESKYLEEMTASSQRRLEAVLKSEPSKSIADVLSSDDNMSSPSLAHAPSIISTAPSQKSFGSSLRATMDPGPGAYLARWENLLENTPLTPMSLKGSPKIKGNEDAVTGKTRPDVSYVIETMGQDFRAAWGKKSMYW